MTGNTNRLVFDVDKKSLRIESYVVIENGGEGPKEKWSLEKSKPMPDFVSIDIQDSEDGIKFYPDGTADKATIKIGIPSGKSFTFLIESATGYVKVEESS